MSDPAPIPPASAPALRVTAMPADANPYGDIFGGWLLAQMDLAAGLAASRRSRGRAATVAIDAVIFHLPVHVGDEVSIFADVVSIGKTSMKIAVDAWRRDRHEEPMRQVTEAVFTFVAIDEWRRPRVFDNVVTPDFNKEKSRS